MFFLCGIKNYKKKKKKRTLCAQCIFVLQFGKENQFLSSKFSILFLVGKKKKLYILAIFLLFETKIMCAHRSHVYY